MYDRKRLDGAIQGIVNKPVPGAAAESFGKRMAAARAAKGGSRGQSTAPPSPAPKNQKRPIRPTNPPMKPIKGTPLAGPIGGDSPRMIPGKNGGGVHVHLYLPSDNDGDEGGY